MNCEYELDLGDIGTFTSTVYFKTGLEAYGNEPFASHQACKEIVTVYVTIGHQSVNVKEFIHSENLDEIKRWITNNVINPED